MRESLHYIDNRDNFLSMEDGQIVRVVPDVGKAGCLWVCAFVMESCDVVVVFWNKETQFFTAAPFSESDSVYRIDDRLFFLGGYIYKS